MFDLVIRAGTVVDGSGTAARTADVAIIDGVVVEVGNVGRALARETIDADGLLVTPGFVDPHTHYDGQMTWDPVLAPSVHHGVTTVVAGNCGVGFAPVRAGAETWLCDLMEGVEDIPGTALIAGIQWGWETFPEYLDVVERLPHAMDVAAMVSHGPLRAYVMGERGARNEPASPADVDEMRRIVAEALTAGALGFSTNRSVWHRSVDGESVPGTFASEEEILGITHAVVDAGHGVIEWAPAGLVGEDLEGPWRELPLMERVSRAYGCPITFGMTQMDKAPDQWREILHRVEQANGREARLRPQVLAKPPAVHVGWRTVHPFAEHPTFKKLSRLGFDEMITRLRDPAIKEQILSEQPETVDPLAGHRTYRAERLFRFSDPPDYEPPPEAAVAAICATTGQPPMSVLYDLMLEQDGEALVFYAVANYTDGDGEATRVMLEHPHTLTGLSDGGAHVRVILDANQPTYMLTHWVRDRSRGPRLALEEVVRRQTSDPAQLFGLLDRGVLAPGYRADVNVIDLERLALGVPRVVNDLPGGAERLMQDAAGYVATIVAGTAIRRAGDDTGERPGRLVRGPQPRPGAT